MSLPEGTESLQNNIAQLCELWYVKTMNNAIDSSWPSYTCIIQGFQQLGLLEKNTSSVTGFLSITLLG